MVRLSQTTDALLENNFLTENKEIQGIDYTASMLF